MLVAEIFVFESVNTDTHTDGQTLVRLVNYKLTPSLHLGRIFLQGVKTKDKIIGKSNRKAMNRNWSNQKANPALKAKTGNK